MLFNYLECNWILFIGATEHINWESNYSKLRKALGYEYPSYLLHESCNWSPYYKEWMFLPRRTSKEPYDEGMSNEISFSSRDLTLGCLVVELSNKLIPERYRHGVAERWVGTKTSYKGEHRRPCNTCIYVITYY